MSRTRRGAKAPGYEYWSRRPYAGGVGKEAKKLTHRAERAANKRDVHVAVKDL